MPQYRVRPGQHLPHGGVVHQPGALVELPAHVAADVEVHYRVELVPAPVDSVDSQPASPPAAAADEE